jgi:hypothetical protein
VAVGTPRAPGQASESDQLVEGRANGGRCIQQRERDRWAAGAEAVANLRHIGTQRSTGALSFPGRVPIVMSSSMFIAARSNPRDTESVGLV